jgi:uncharacterized protein (TIGR00369 family)
MLRAAMDASTLQRWVEETPFHAQVAEDVTIAVVDAGVELRATLPPSAANERDGTVAHGGAVTTLLDSALTFALIAATDGDWSTADLRVDFLRPVTVGPVRATGRVVKAGRRVGRADGSLFDGDGAECARAIGTFIPA